MSSSEHIAVDGSASNVHAPAVVAPTDREKFEFDREIRLREINLKEAEATRLSEESKRSRWTNPFVVAIIGAAVVGSSPTIRVSVSFLQTLGLIP